MSKPKRQREHRLEFNKKIGRMRCSRCGLLRLKNDASARGLAKKCDDDLYDGED